MRYNKSGTFVLLNLADGSFAYGRVLSEPYVAFYNFRTQSAVFDLDLIENNTIIFRQCVRSGNWKNMGHRDLSGDVAEPTIRFTQSQFDYKNCLIYDSLGNEKSATPEECVGLERAAAWEPVQIENRILDFFLGKDNENEIMMRVRLS